MAKQQRRSSERESHLRQSIQTKIADATPNMVVTDDDASDDDDPVTHPSSTFDSGSEGEEIMGWQDHKNHAAKLESALTNLEYGVPIVEPEPNTSAQSNSIPTAPEGAPVTAHEGAPATVHEGATQKIAGEIITKQNRNYLLAVAILKLLLTLVKQGSLGIEI